jgi:Protein of unknown function (DUF3738)
MLAAAVWSGTVAMAQPSFEVASVRSHSSGDRLTNRFLLGGGGRFTASNCSLRLLIRLGLRRSLISGGGGAGLGRLCRALCGELPNSPGQAQGNKLTSSELAGSLSFFLGRPVIDKTGLTGKYDIELRWTPEQVLLQSSAPPEAPTIFTALREQLGLKLESGKGPVKTLVIDHVERASEN